MKEQFKTILDNEELDSKSKVEEIARIVGEQTVIKSKFNEVNTKLQTLESEKESISSELDTIKNSNMTNEQKLAKQEELAKEEKTKYSKLINKAQAEKLLGKAGLKEEDYADILDDLISEDADSTAKRVQGIAKILESQKVKVTDATKEDLLKDTPRPNEEQKNANGIITKEVFNNMDGNDRVKLFKENRELFNQLTQN